MGTWFVDTWTRWFRFFYTFFLLAFWRTLVRRHPLLLLIMVAPAAILLGLGRSFGLPRLFWLDEQWLVFLNGLVVGTLYVFLWFAAFLLDSASWPEPAASVKPEMQDETAAQPVPGNQPRTWVECIPVKAEGIIWQFVFYIIGLLWSLLLVSLVLAAAAQVGGFFVRHGASALLLMLGIVVAIGVALGIAAGVRPLQRIRDARTPESRLSRLIDGGWSIGRVGPGWASLVILALVCAATAAAALVGIRVGLFLIPWLLAMVLVTAYRLCRLAHLKVASDERLRPYTVGALVIALLGLLFVLLALIDSPLITAVSLCALCAMLGMLYVIVRAYLRLPPWSVAGLVVLLIAVAGISPSRIRVGALDRAVEDLPQQSRGNTASGSPPRSVDARASGAEGGELLGNSDIKWRSNAVTPLRPLVLVAASGGGVSAAVWTTSVLKTLEERMPEFPYHIRLITGASGGMLGAAHYVSNLSAPGVGAAPTPDKARLIGEIGKDALSAVTQRLVFNDLPQMALPFRNSVNRGEALESAFVANSGRLASTFQGLEQGEKDGWRPSLVFSPTIVENGHRLLISNLDLSSVCSIACHGPAKVQEQQVANDCLQLFAVYPEARKSLNLATAARLNASFPLVSPAPVLPFRERVRVVDAGYFDNHGVELACRWLDANREWIRANVSRILVVQVRTFPRTKGYPSSSIWTRGVEDVLSPIDGLFGAREGAMQSRNDQQLAAIERAFAEEGLPDVATVALECQTDALPLTWTLSHEEREGIADAVDQPMTRSAMDDIQEWFERKNAERKWDSDPSIAQLRKTKRLRLAFAQGEDTGWLLTQNGSTAQGFEIELARQITARLGQKLRIPDLTLEVLPPAAWNQLLHYPRRGRAEMIVSSLSFAPDRQDTYGLRFSLPYHRARQAVFWIKATQPDSVDVLKEAKIGFQKETTSERLITEFSRTRPGWRDVKVEQQRPMVREVLDDLRSGRVDYAIMDQPYVVGAGGEPPVKARALADTEMPEPWLGRPHMLDEYYCIGMSEESTQFQWLVNLILTELAREGRLVDCSEEFVLAANDSRTPATTSWTDARRAWIDETDTLTRKKVAPTPASGGARAASDPPPGGAPVVPAPTEKP